MFKFTIDKWLNPYILPNQSRRLPQPLRRFTGGHTAKPVPDYLIWLEILVGSFCGILMLEGMFKSHTVFSNHHLVHIIASYGATAILCFNANSSPLAQPRNVLVGQITASIISICIQKLFSLSAAGRDNYYVGGALSVAVLSVAMTILNCVHPPAGASALLPFIDTNIRAMSWWYIPAQIVSSLLIIAVASITGNVFRVYPTFWWTAAKVGKQIEEEEKEALAELVELSDHLSDGGSLTVQETLTRVNSHTLRYSPDKKGIQITKDRIVVPSGFEADELQLEWLETLQRGLRDMEEDEGEV